MRKKCCSLRARVVHEYERCRLRAFIAETDTMQRDLRKRGGKTAVTKLLLLFTIDRHSNFNILAEITAVSTIPAIVQGLSTGAIYV